MILADFWKLADFQTLFPNTEWYIFAKSAVEFIIFSFALSSFSFRVSGYSSARPKFWKVYLLSELYFLYVYIVFQKRVWV